MPPKIWRPKPQNRYIPLDYGDDVDEGVFEFAHFGKTVFRPKIRWADKPRTDIIQYDKLLDEEELMANLHVGNNIEKRHSDAIILTIQKYWDSFCKRGARRTILDYEFSIDTGASKPVCCRRPTYGPHERPIILEQISSLLDNDWIEECGGAWGSMIVLAAKPHQEHIEDIKNFIWRMCVSYRGLNKVTKPFEYPIPRCDDAIHIFQVGSCQIWVITVDARQGYHQVCVRAIDREKLAFFSPDDKKYCFKVMPFGPVNAPSFYSCMMGNFKKEWDALFLEILEDYADTGKLLDGKSVRIVNGDIYIGITKIYSGTKSIIDDVLIWCSDIPCILIYFECVCRVFQKYRVSFRQDKCHFLLDRVEYVGHDLLADGNCPAKSKFNMITDWALPTTGAGLHSFVGLVMFYHRYAPYLEMRVKPLRILIKQYFRMNIPIMAWTVELIKLFEDIKISITSSPVLARYDPSKPTFLKTDWSAEGMGWIMMQPADDAESTAATTLLLKTGECKFDLTKGGARLRPTGFGSRCCLPQERKYHSFVGEAACGRWAISQNRRYLWGAHFWWICDCLAIKEILDYDGPIAMIYRWAQELLGYHFSILHRLARMMIDVDGLSRRLGAIIPQHLCVAALFHKIDRAKRPLAYTRSLASTPADTKIVHPQDGPSAPNPILISSLIASLSVRHVPTTDDALIHLCTSTPKSTPTVYLHSVPILLTTSPLECVETFIQGDGTSSSPALLAADSTICT